MSAVIPLRAASSITLLQILSAVEAERSAQTAAKEAGRLRDAVVAQFSRQHGYLVPLRPEAAERLAKEMLYGKVVEK